MTNRLGPEDDLIYWRDREGMRVIVQASRLIPATDSYAGRRRANPTAAQGESC